MKKKDELPACPVATTVQMIGSKWKLLILRNLLARPWRFNELQKSLEGVSQKVLTDSLRSMEADGIITRTVYPEVPPGVKYALSDLGKTMRPIIASMEAWGLKYKENYAQGDKIRKDGWEAIASHPSFPALRYCSGGYHDYSIAMYFCSSTWGASFFGISSFNTPFSKLARISSCVTFSPT